jgi:hypothetical protein
MLGNAGANPVKTFIWYDYGFSAWGTLKKARKML